MRIGIEAQRLFRKKKHGMDIVTLEIIRNLQKIDSENEYFIYIKKGEDAQCLTETENFKIRVLPNYNYAIWEQILLPQAAKKDDIDLLHCTSNTAPIFYHDTLIITLHDIIYLENYNLSGSLYQKLGNFYRRIVVPKVVKKCDHIITVSLFEKQNIIDFFKFGKDDVSVIYNGVGVNFKTLSNEKLPTELANIANGYILFLGNTAYKKNTIGVLRAFKMYVQATPKPLKLVITDVDKAYVKKLLKRIKALWLLNYIEIFGYISFSRMPLLYNGAKLFLYPSLRESFGLPLLEAMACGTPVLTSNVSAMPEIAGDAAKLIDPIIPKSIADGITEMLESEEDLKVSRNVKGLAHAKRFAWNTSAHKLLEVYNELYSKKVVS
jgi:glycosyltransferase involved in cell wall biosynthesis